MCWFGDWGGRSHLRSWCHYSLGEDQARRDILSSILDKKHLRWNTTFKGGQAPSVSPPMPIIPLPVALCDGLSPTPERWAPEGSQLPFPGFSGRFQWFRCQFATCQLGFGAAVQAEPSKTAFPSHLFIVKLLTIKRVQVRMFPNPTARLPSRLDPKGTHAQSLSITWGQGLD